VGIARFAVDAVNLLALNWTMGLNPENHFFCELIVCRCGCEYPFSKDRGVFIFKNPIGLFIVEYECAIIASNFVNDT
jgi:hypothetical protein